MNVGEYMSKELYGQRNVYVQQPQKTASQIEPTVFDIQVLDDPDMLKNDQKTINRLAQFHGKYLKHQIS